MGPFELGIRAFAEKAGENADLVTRKVILDVWARLILKSPVDTGRFRANWQYSINAQATGTIATAGTTLSPAPAPGAPDVRPGAFGKVHFITNNVPHAIPLERGWSKQAPIGLVALTAMEFNAIASEAAAQAYAGLGVLGRA